MEYSKKHKIQAGFSLIELMVTLMIATLIVGGVLFQFRVFDSVIGLRGEAYDLASTLRTAQVYTVSAGISDDRSRFDRSVGVHYNVSSPQQYILFEDSNDNNQYNTGDAIIETYTIPDNYRISYICVETNCINNNVVTVLFQRPEFDAIFSINNTLVSASEVLFGVALTNNTAEVFNVEVGATGQITVATP